MDRQTERQTDKDKQAARTLRLCGACLGSPQLVITYVKRLPTYN